MNKHVDRWILPCDFDLANYHNDAKDNMPITVSEFSNLIKPYFNRLDSINNRLDIYKTEQNYCSEKMASLYKIIEVKRQDSVNAFKEKELSSLQHQIDSMKMVLKGQDSTEMVLKGKYVELSQLEVNYATKACDVQTYILSNWGLFIPDTLSEQFGQYQENEFRLSDEIFQLENLRRDVSLEIYNSKKSFHKNRLASVNIGDFLYYSICVSTSVSFGDIAPNNGQTRLVAIIELLLCILIVGIIIGTILEKTKDNKETE